MKTGGTPVAVVSPTPTTIIESPTILPSATPQQADTSNWKVYRNDEYGFLFRYPINALASISDAPYNDPKFANDIWSVAIECGDNCGGYVMSLMIGNVNNLNQKDGYPIMIGGKMAYRFDDCGQGGCNYEYLVPVKNTVLTFFGASCDEGTDPRKSCTPEPIGTLYEEAFLSTFTFIQ
jgi:hypothetical protein